MSSILGIAALAIAVVALVVSFAVPGPIGATGPAGTNGATGQTGLTGPAGPGTLMVSNSTSKGVAIGSTCTQYTGAQITITVPRSGTVIITATVMLAIFHTSGTEDNAWVFVQDTTTACGPEPFMGIMVVPAALATDSYWQTVTAMKNYTVSGAGTHTYYVTGIMDLGGSTGDSFFYGNLVAVFYPD